MTSTEEKVANIFGLYEKYGTENYIGEKTILAAFLHDIGHLIGQDDSNFKPMITGEIRLGAKRHEEIGADFLENLGLTNSFTSIIRHHVNAKRYLCYKNMTYFKKLSDASKMTLEHQGGKMTGPEAEEFEKHPKFNSILKMRGWDEEAKVVGMKIDPLHKYQRLMINYLSSL
ncbi:DgyrCDS10495 [Dimorphilus gyrociliatus]|uniref:DgyrCDS10495 n=1 Tax=Dimorphilus gyrociliatus TaxID=2664684 RepID=A0A7I8W2Y4_9ANNE|nr:DgyrCDS10495 [Dimorphilus gyrociliatus]